MVIRYGVRFPAGPSDVSLFHSVQTGFVTWPAPIPGGKAAGGVQPTTNLHLYLQSPVCLHGSVLH
jgi:hypothetical protein